MTSISDTLRLALLQLNPTLGDLAGNADKLRAARATAAAQGADLLVTTELFISGYPPEDLVLKPAFVRACRREIEALAKETADGGPAILIGSPWMIDDKLHNVVCLLDGGEIQAVRAKVDLPNYGPFDEKRVFTPGPLPGSIAFRGMRIGVPICEDTWNDEVCECLAETGAEILIVPNGSPYWADKADERIQVMVARVVESELPLVYVNQVCGQDELVFDGASFAFEANRTLSIQMSQFEEEVATFTWKRDGETWKCVDGTRAALPGHAEAQWRACVMGLRDYVNKNGFPGVILGLSGGIDSAVCAAMAVDALGADKVRCVMLPYHYTASESLEDAEACTKALGVSYEVVPIELAVSGMETTLKLLFDDLPANVAEENVQARTRGVILMAISNKFGPMLVTTGNKSEMSVGYATLYGDMNGGFNPIKDLYKTEVFKLAAWRNSHRPVDALGPDGVVIPERIITKPPSAELRPDQTDQDSLPPYDVLDDILECLVEREMGISEIAERGHDEQLINRIQNLLYVAEYKRRQAPPGVKVTSRNFGRDRRYPITNQFRDKR
ncbi:NAD+ synthase [Breoghania sp.]|uniref:NAD+ synthase n=1 Tax=Breoghania sp. TaxID=2065378 RepID=UPI002630131B|nr:NAD+ synthase [Breoghania sp.]MDJ0932699.1 NAD+ synthase [Breoghania sp.]